MHVVLFSHEYPPYVFGGVGTFVEDLARGLSKLGTQVTVISGYPVSFKNLGSTSVIEEENAGVAVLRFPYPNIYPRHTSFQLFNMRKFAKVLMKIKPDVINGQGGSTYPALIALRKIAPLAVTFHSSPKMQQRLGLFSLLHGGSMTDFYTFGVGYPAWAFTVRKEFVGSSAAVAVSENLMKQLVSEIHTKPRGQVSFIHNGVDIAKLDDTISTASSRNGDAPTIIFGGRLFWSKGVMNLLGLAHLLERRYHANFRIVIYGSGPMYKTMIKKIQERRLRNVALKGFIGRDEFLKEMRTSSFVVIPSFYEAAPMILLESMCMGKMPVMFSLPYALEFTEGGRYGIVANNIEQMAARVVSTFGRGDKDILEKRIRDFGRANYDIKKTAQEYRQLYSGICK